MSECCEFANYHKKINSLYALSVVNILICVMALRCQIESVACGDIFV